MDERRIAQIVEQVVARLATDGSLPSTDSRGPNVPRHGRGSGDVSTDGMGVHPTVDAAVVAARSSYEALSACSLADRGRYIQALRDVTYRELNNISRLAVEESGLGRVDDKVAKNRLVADKTPGIEAMTSTAWTGDNGLTLVEIGRAHV